MSDGKAIELKRERNEAVQPKSGPVEWPRTTKNELLRVGPQKFPSLEEQKLADLAYKCLGLELEPIGEADLKRVKALGYDGGVKVASGMPECRAVPDSVAMAIIQHGDILVGLGVWPTTDMKSVAQILTRGDLAELNPLKFYVVREGNIQKANEPPTTGDIVVTGRVSVKLDAVPHQSSSPLFQ